ncbi:MAG: hypothetical protein B6241_09690 [Spirochaetaceae bacterium 4572_59]|nr:MAG: hypothetical protein B6241_09690 [Spirochaetaceae bacterium 4572_59]
MKRTVSIFLILAGITFLAAESPLVLTEEMAVAMALGQNLSLQASRLDLENSEDLDNNSWNVLLPDFSASGGITRSEALISDPLPNARDSWSVNGSVSAKLTLNYGAVLSMNTYSLRYDAQSVLFEMEQDRLITNVRKQFSYLLANKENLILEKKNLELAEKRYEQTLANYENGLASELSVMEAKTSYESLRPAYTNTRTSYETQVMSFKNLLGFDMALEIDVEGTLDIPLLDLDADDLVQSYLANRRDVQTGVTSLELEENLLAAVKAGKLTPSLILSSDWSSSAGDLTDPDWADSATLSLLMSFPLNGYIGGSSEKVDIRHAERSVEQARLSLEETMERAEQEIRTLVMQLEGYKENMEITGLSVDLAQKTYEMTEFAYQQGTREILDVEAAQNKLLAANQDLLQSRYNYLSGLLDLDYALNTTLEEMNGEYK